MLPFLLLCLAAVAEVSPEVLTRELLDLWIAGKYDAIYARLAGEGEQVTVEKLAEQLERVRSMGSVRINGEPKAEREGEYSIVTIPIEVGPMTLQFQATWDKNNRIAGLGLVLRESKIGWQAPPYVREDAFTEREIVVGQDPWKLPGTLSIPKSRGPFPAVVLVHGSGANDRDESIGGVKVFKDLAGGLATRGIAVVRYEKRTRAHPHCAADPKFTMTLESVDDAVLAVALLRAEPAIDPKRIFVAGHSQGGYIAPRIGKRIPDLAGLIVIAGHVRPLEELVAEQTEYLTGERPKEEVQKFHAVLPAAYFADLKGYNPASEAARLGVPMLILQGERDYQVTMKDFALWKAAVSGRKNVTFRSYPKLNHLLVAGEGKSLPAEYMKPNHVDAAIIEDIVKWLIGNPSS